MYIGKISEQSADLKVNAINRSAAQKNEEITGIRKEETRDVVAISPVGKKQSLIEQLMKQKENLREMKDSKIASAAENGQSIQQELDEYDQQIKDIDEQIAQLQREPQDDVENKEDESGIYENPRTKEEVQQDQISQLTGLAADSDQAEVLSSIKDKVDRNISVLKSEIQSGWGVQKTKLEAISEMENRSEDLAGDISQKLQETNHTVSDMREAVSKTDNADNDDSADITAEQNDSIAEQVGDDSM